MTASNASCAGSADVAVCGYWSLSPAQTLVAIALATLGTATSTDWMCNVSADDWDDGRCGAGVAVAGVALDAADDSNATGDYDWNLSMAAADDAAAVAAAGVDVVGTVTNVVTATAFAHRPPNGLRSDWR